MLKGFWGGRRSAAIGIDLGSSSVKAVEISRSKITLAALRELSPAEKAEDALLSVRLKEFFSGTGVLGRNASIAVPGEYVFIRTVSFPSMPAAELKEAVRWELKRNIPYAEEEAVTDFISAQSSEGISVTFAAAEKKNVQRFVSLFRDAGLNISAVDIGALALLRTFNPAEPDNCIIADIGSGIVEISIVKGGILRLTRTVGMGSGLIVNALISSGKGYEEAAAMLYGKVAEEMKAPLDQLVREVSRSVDYYKANFKEKIFSSLLLTGGISLNADICKYISAGLNMPVKVPDPFAGFSLRDESIRALGPRFSLAVGLARRNI